MRQVPAREEEKYTAGILRNITPFTQWTLYAVIYMNMFIMFAIIASALMAGSLFINITGQNGLRNGIDRV